MKGEKRDVLPIKVDRNHRYIACRLAGIDIGIIPWNGGNIDKVINWLDIKIDDVDWGIGNEKYIKRRKRRLTFRYRII
ncbi:hypothetical protein [Thomasclavelia cocleata]|uniref:hypothetical protein n=1 Tax=Thomasclavelia cocleata TaxID=69824 RepID=UPI00255B3064|nr:hypothetical protein [Thomasclavelia cocleata]